MSAGDAAALVFIGLPVVYVVARLVFAAYFVTKQEHERRKIK